MSLISCMNIPFRSNLLWSSHLILTNVNHKSKEVFIAIFSGKPFYHIKLLLFVGSIQPHGPSVQQGEAAIHIGLLYHLDRYFVFCNGAAKCNFNSNSCHHASDCLGMVCGELYPRGTDRAEVFHKAMLWLLQKFCQQKFACLRNLLVFFRICFL